MNGGLEKHTLNTQEWGAYVGGGMVLGMGDEVDKTKQKRI